MTIVYDDRLTQTIISSDWHINVFWSDYSEEAVELLEIESSASIVNTHKKVTLNEYGVGDQILFFSRAQQNGLQNVVASPSIAYYSIDDMLYPINWAVFPHITYLTENDRYALTYWGNVIEDASGHIVDIVDASQYNLEQLEATKTETEEKKDDASKDGDGDAAVVVTKYQNVDSRATTDPIVLRTDTKKAILYCIGKHVSTYTVDSELKHFFVFSAPVALKIFPEFECVVDFHTSGDGGSSCRIPYYVS